MLIRWSVTYTDGSTKGLVTYATQPDAARHQALAIGPKGAKVAKITKVGPA